MLEGKVLVLDLSLDEGEQLLKMILALINFGIITLNFLLRHVWIAAHLATFGLLIILQQTLLHLSQRIRLINIHSIEKLLIAGVFLDNLRTMRLPAHIILHPRVLHLIFKLLQIQCLNDGPIHADDDVRGIAHA